MTPPPVILHTIRTLRVDGVVKVLLRNLRHHDHTRFRHCVGVMRREDALAGELAALGIEPMFLDHGGTPDVPGTVRRIGRLLGELNVALVHANRTEDLALAGAAARGRGIPVVSSIHWLGRPSEQPQDAHLPWARRYGEMMATVAVNRALATRIIAVSDAVRRSYGSLPGFPRERAEVVYPGIDMHEPPPLDAAGAAALRAELGVAGRSPVLLNVGRLHGVKGQRHLVPAMAELRKRLPDAVLLIAGGGPLEGELRREVAAAGLEDAVRLLGVRSDVDALLAASDLLILASESEAAPLPLFEAMRAARPVVATAVGGVPELVQDGVTGALVPRADPAAIAAAVLRICGDRGRAAEMGRAARAHGLERFDIRRSVRRIEEIYRELLSGAPPRGSADAAHLARS